MRRARRGSGMEVDVASASVILLVTDIPDHIGVYGAAVRARGYRVAHARTGEDGLILATGSPPRCIVIDVRLPDMTGWELCRRIKAHAALAGTPVVVLAQEMSSSGARSSREVGCSAWLARPTVADDLVRAVEYVLALGISEPPTREAAVLGIRECPACGSEELRAGVRIGPVQYYGCLSCGMRWRVDAQGEAIA